MSEQVREEADMMNLRDYFAAQALAGVGTWIPSDAGGHLGMSHALKARAEWAYRQADALLAARGDNA